MTVEHPADVADMVAALPSAKKVLALRPSSSLNNRIRILLEKKRNEGLAPEEAAEWEDIIRAENLMRVAKAKAAIGLKSGVNSK